MHYQIQRPAVLSFVLLLSCFAAAQDTASLTGTVRDSSGAVLPKASVSLKNNATGSTRDLITNSQGEYLAAALPPGQYDVTVVVPGFRTYQAKGVTLRVAQNARIDVTLQVGSVSSQVTVLGEGPRQSQHPDFGNVRHRYREGNRTTPTQWS